MFLLDTNVVSALKRIDADSRGVQAWLQSITPDDIRICPVTIAELEQGYFRQLKRDRVAAVYLRLWIDRIAYEFANRMVLIDASAGRHYAQIQAVRTLPIQDAWLAATAIANDLTVVTRNVRDFAGTGAKLFDPWTRTFH